MSNTKKTETTVENTDLKIDEDENQKTIKELKAQVALLTQMITSQSQKNIEAEHAFFKQKEVNFKVTTFREPGKSLKVQERQVNGLNL